MASKKSLEKIIADVQENIEEMFDDLSDSEYISAMDRIASFCTSCSEAKQEDLEEDPSDEDEDEDE